MNAFPFRPDKKMTDVLARGEFTLSAEVIPPRNGVEQGKVLQQIEALVNAGAQFLAVTKGAGGSLRGGSLPIAQVVKEQFKIPCIAHFTCRDLDPMEVENHLMDHHYFGIRNILALRGDPPDGSTEWKAKAGGYNYAYQLIAQIKNLNEGKYLSRVGGPQVDVQMSTDFCIGAAAYPEFPDPKARIEYFKMKTEAGAQFGITDMLFDPESYARFMEDCAKAGIQIPVLPGTRLLKTRPQAARMAAKFKVQVPKEVLTLLPEEDTPDAVLRGTELMLKLAEKLKSYGAPGVHIYVISDTQGACSALSQLAKSGGGNF